MVQCSYSDKAKIFYVTEIFTVPYIQLPTSRIMGVTLFSMIAVLRKLYEPSKSNEYI